MWQSIREPARRHLPFAPVAIFLVSIAAGASEPPPGGSVREPLKVLTTARFEGVGSCSASACHNGRIARDGLPGSEHSLWVTRDRHATAYTVLLGERSRRIERNFRRDQARKPERDALCLNCHSHMQFETALHARNYDVADGVGCESCHGAAERWIAPHTTAGWKSLPEAQKTLYGFYPTEDLADRARMCAECHVGTTRRTNAGELVEVNHDLIAAGHPRLAFEYAAYLGLEPKHWLINQERARTPDLEARSYAVGQLVSLQSSLDLLSERARTASQGKTLSAKGQVWPELTEYGCYACHHALADPSKTQDRGYPNRTPGSLPWNTWYTPTLGVLNDAIGPETPTALLPKIAELGDLMAASYPDPAESATLAAEAAESLEPWIRRLRTRPIDASRQKGMMAAIASQGTESPQDWDASAQAFLGLAALHQALGEDATAWRDPALREPLRRMVPALMFARGTDSPGPSRLGDPIKAELERIRGILNR